MKKFRSAGLRESDFQELKTKADGGDAISQHIIGRRYRDNINLPENIEEGKRLSLALSHFQKSAAQNYAPALFSIANMYVKRLGINSLIKPDKADEIAVFYFSQAVEKHYAPALIDLGTMYKINRGVDKTLSKERRLKIAFKYYSAAAKSDLPEGKFNVALCYLYNKGVERNLSSSERFQFAEQWATKAIKSDSTNKQATNLLAHIQEQLAKCKMIEKLNVLAMQADMDPDRTQERRSKKNSRRVRFNLPEGHKKKQGDDSSNDKDDEKDEKYERIQRRKV